MWRLARLSLANRSVVALAAVAVAVFGVLSAGALKQELIPSLQIPAAVVIAVDPGSSPELVESQVTQPLESAISAVRDVKQVTSQSTTSVSATTVEFTYGIDLDRATQALQQAVNRAQTSLPSGVQPTVMTGTLDDLPVVQLAVTGSGDQADTATLAATLHGEVVPRLQQISGVRDVTVTGLSTRQVVVALDMRALTAAGASPTAASAVLKDNGVVIPAGTVADGSQTLSVQAGSPLTSVDDIAALPLTTATGTVVHLGDVAKVSEVDKAPTSFSRLNGSDALAIAITKTPAGNTVDVSHGVSDAVAELSAAHAGNLQFGVVFDQAPFIEESISGLSTEGGLGLLFAVVVILLFLTSLRSTIVSALSIPLSLLVTFIGLRVGGYSLNILTLGAMTVAIGRVVDDSIVIIENIKRHLSYGEPKRDAILAAVREVAGAVTASTITTVSVFLPIGLVGGMVGELFRPFAVTVAVAMLASLVVALSIVPVLAYWFIKAPPAAQDVATVRAEAEERERHTRLQRTYLSTLRGAIGHPVVTIIAAVVVFGGTVALVPRLETNFLGDVGQDTATVTEQFPPATSLTAQDDAARRVEKAIMGVSGVQNVQTTIGSSGGMEALFMGGGGAPRATFALTMDATADSLAVRDEVRTALSSLTAGDQTLGTITVAGAEAMYGVSTVDVIVQAADPQQLATLASQVEDVVKGVPGTTDVTNNLAGAQPTVQLVVDRQAAAAAGLTEVQVAGTVAQTLSPQPIGKVDVGGGPIDVVVDAGMAPSTVQQLQAMVLPTARGPVPLTQVASVQTVEAPTAITRIDGQRSATISATPAGQDLGALTTSMQTAIDGIDVPAGASVEIGGVAAQQSSAFSDLGTALLIAIALVYLIMVATFRSLLQPLILLVSVPFAATGALLALLSTGTPLGVPALIGLLMLVGIVVTNAIVLIDLINQYRGRGRDIGDAVTEGARKRLRPIVMTAAATIFALLPMAFGLTGGGVFISKPLAIVVIGGLVTSTLLTLVLVPVLYTVSERASARSRERRARRHAERDGGEPAAREDHPAGRHAEA